MFLLLSIILISAAAISFEILLIKLLSFMQWSHFVSLVISLSLFGYAVSGTFLAVKKNRVINFYRNYALNAFLFALFMPLSVYIVQTVPTNFMEILWDIKQLLYLTITYCVLALPFFFAANCIGLTLINRGEQVHAVYRNDLIGAGIGAMLLIGLLIVFRAEYVLLLLVILPLVAALMVSVEKSSRSMRVLEIAICVLISSLVFFSGPFVGTLKTNPFKALSRVKNMPMAETVRTYHGPVAILDVVESDLIPFRNAPGLSLNFTGQIPAQLGLFINGDSFSTILKQIDIDRTQYFNYLPGSLPHMINYVKRALILNYGGGDDVLMARYFAVEQIDAVDRLGIKKNMLQRDLKEFVGDNFQHINFFSEESRSFVSRSKQAYDLISLPIEIGDDGEYLYTVEAFVDYLNHLTNDGIISVQRTIKLPPRDSLKLFYTGIKALEQLGIKNYADHMVLIRSLQTTLLLIKKSRFSSADLARVRQFSMERSYDLVYLPGVTNTDVNRFNRLVKPFFYQGTQRLLSGGAAKYISGYKYNLKPATDNRPNFYHFFKWETFVEILKLKDQGGLPLLGWSFPMKLLALVSIVVLSLLFVITPLLLLTRKNEKKHLSYIPYAIYFFLLGIGFLTVELSFIHKLTLYLGDPIYSATIVICGFLVFAGIGAQLSKIVRMNRNGIWYSLACLLFLLVIYAFFLNDFLQSTLMYAFVIRVLLGVIIIIPLAVLMGMFFPYGIFRLTFDAPEFIPWAWGINGMASVISPVLAAILLIYFGHQMVFVVALGCYAGVVIPLKLRATSTY